MDVAAINSLASCTGEACNVHHTPHERSGQESSGKGKQSKSWSKTASKAKSNDVKGGKSEVPNVPKVCTRVKHRKLAYLDHTDNSSTDNSWFDGGWSYDEWTDSWSSVGWHEGWEQTYDRH